MDYVYDIVLNFQKEYYDFYEWRTSDKIINIKKISIYKIKTSDYLNIKLNDVIIDKNTFSNKNKMFLLTNGLEIMGILINNDGRVVKRSSLIFEEADSVLEDSDNILTIDIKYKINNINKLNYLSRFDKEKREYVLNYFKNIDMEKDKYFIKFLYYDIFMKDEKDINTIYNKLLELSTKDVEKLYSSIKKVNLELGKEQK